MRRFVVTSIFIAITALVMSSLPNPAHQGGTPSSPAKARLLNSERIWTQPSPLFKIVELHSSTTTTPSTLMPSLPTSPSPAPVPSVSVSSSTTTTVTSPPVVLAAPAPPSAPPPTSPGPTAEGASNATSTATADWECIRRWESGGDYSIASGAYGFMASTAASLGWSYPVGSSVSPETQDAAALQLFARNGYHFGGTWNGSTQRCGLY